MVRKKAQFEQAKELRKRGFTYEEIAKIVDVSVSTVSLWLSRETWSKAITLDNKKRAAKENKKRISLLNTARGNQNAKTYRAVEHSASIEYKHYKNNPLFVAGLMIYLSIGDQAVDRPIRISSVQNEVHRIFIAFATDFLGVSREKIRFWVLIDEKQQAEKCLNTWSKAIGIPRSQFFKSQIQRGVTSALHDGAGNTIIGSVLMKKKLLAWVALASKEHT